MIEEVVTVFQFYAFLVSFLAILVQINMLFLENKFPKTMKQVNLFMRSRPGKERELQSYFPVYHYIMGWTKNRVNNLQSRKFIDEINDKYCYMRKQF
jgi:hypothetical protein